VAVKTFMAPDSCLHPTVVVRGDTTYVAWETSKGKVEGKVLANANFSELYAFTLPDTSSRSSPVLVSDNGVVVLYAVKVQGGLERYEVAQDGQAGPGVVLSPQLFTNPAPSAGKAGPFMYAVAYNDTMTQDKKGAYVMLDGPVCGKGPVDCSNGAKVCTGIGTDGYVALSNAQGWCP